MIHEAGYLHNDIKLNNICIGDDMSLPHAKHSLYKVRLIDFGLASKYTNQIGSHIPMKSKEVFEGNMMFCSKNISNMMTASRRDDLISLCYILLYIVDGNLPFKIDKSFDTINRMKNTVTTKELCCTPEGKRLYPFVNEILSLKFEETPDYERLGLYLVSALSEINETLDMEYDWNKGIP